MTYYLYLKKSIMKRKILLLLFSIFVIKFSMAQTPGKYYYSGQATSMSFSNRVLFVKFTPTLTNTQKLSIITNASVDLLNATSENIPDYVKLQSRIISGWRWVYPCAAEPILKPKDSSKPIANYVPLPCDTCHNCTPYQQYYSINNFDNALTEFSNNTNIQSASAGITMNDPVDTIGLDEAFFIKIKPGYSLSDFTNLINAYSLTAQDVSTDFGSGVYKISTTRADSKNLISRANLFYETGYCIFSSPDFCYINRKYSNDPYYSQQWGLKNTGQYSGYTAGSDIRIEQAWPFSKGLGVKIAVIDLGVQINHPDLQQNIVSGYDATLQGTGGKPFDLNDYHYAHGTNVAGIVGAVADNNEGIAGVAPQAKIIPINGFKRYNYLADEDMARAIIWAYKNGAADIINCSWGGGAPNDLLTQAIKEAATLGRNGKGCVIVFAAGQSENLSNQIGYVAYPGKLPEVIAVGGMTPCNQRLFAYGDPGVHIGCSGDEMNSFFGPDLEFMAPGTIITTTDYQSGYISSFGGTSAAAPFVSGIAALVLSVNPTLTKDQVQRILEYSCNKVGQYCYSWTPAHPHGGWNFETGFGRINAHNAVELATKAVSFSSPVYDVAATSSNPITGYIQMAVLSSTCASISSAAYYFKRYEVSANITFPFTSNPLIICSSNGWSAANPNNTQNYAVATNVTNTSATLKTYIYEGYNILGQNLGMTPAAANQIKFQYTVIGAGSTIPYESSLMQGGGIKDTIKINFDFDKPGPTNDMPYIFADKIDISPNPSVDKISINIKPTDVLIEIFDQKGVKVISRTLSEKYSKVNISFDVSHLQKGMYFVIVHEKTGSKKSSFVKL